MSVVMYFCNGYKWDVCLCESRFIEANIYIYIVTRVRREARSKFAASTRTPRVPRVRYLENGREKRDRRAVFRW